MVKELTLLLREISEYESIKSRLSVLLSTGEAQTRNQIKERLDAIQAMEADWQKKSPVISSILNQLSQDVPEILRFDGRILYVGGDFVGGAEFNDSNCVEVFRWAEKTLYFTMQQMQSQSVSSFNWKGLASAYETMVKIIESAADMKRETVSRFQNALNQEVQELRGRLEELAQSYNEFQERIKSSERIKNELCLDGKPMFNCEYSEKLEIPLGYSEAQCNFEGRQVRLINQIKYWDMTSQGFCAIAADHDDPVALSQFMQYTLYRVLLSYPVSDVKIAFYDACAAQYFAEIKGVFKRQAPQFMFGMNPQGAAKPDGTEDRLDSKLYGLKEIIANRIALLKVKGEKNILLYNKHNPDSVQPLIFAILKDIDDNIRDLKQTLNFIVESGGAAGVFLLLVNSKIFEDKNLIKICANGSGKSFVTGGVTYTPIFDKDFLTEAFWEGLTVEIKNSKKILPIENILTVSSELQNDRRENFSDVLEIPVGKTDEGIFSVKFETKKTNAHMIVTGATGTGKSNFLKTLVLSGAYMYAPDELQFYIIAMGKDELKMFRNLGLPHLKLPVGGNEKTQAIDALGFIENMLAERSRIIGTYGSIGGYNRAVPPERRLPRILIIVDELHTLIQQNPEYVFAIDHLAETGRALGVGLVLGTQKITSEIARALNNIANRIEFSTEENFGSLIDGIAARQWEVKDRQGYCFHRCGTKISLVRTAYSGEEQKDIAELVGKIKALYPESKMELITDTDKEVITDSSQLPDISYQSDCTVRLGRNFTTGVAVNYRFLTGGSHCRLVVAGRYNQENTGNVLCAVVRDALYLSRNTSEPTVYILDFNPERRHRVNAPFYKKIIAESWTRSDSALNRCKYFPVEAVNKAIEEISDIVSARGQDEKDPVFPIMVIVLRAENMDSLPDRGSSLNGLMARGAENDVFFTLQCNTVSKLPSMLLRDLSDAIIIPSNDGDMLEMLESFSRFKASETEEGRELKRRMQNSEFNERIHLLCRDLGFSRFLPYVYAEDYFKKL